MFARSFFRWSVAGASLTGLMLTSVQAQAVEDTAVPETTAASPVAKGIVMRGGAPIRDADVVVRLWPDQDTLAAQADSDPVTFHVAGATETDEQGRYQIDIDPTSVPAAFVHEASGLVDVEVMVATATEEMRWNYSAKPSNPAQAADGAWTLGQRRGGDREGAVDTRLDFGARSAWERADDPLEWVDGTGKALGAARGASRAAVSAVTRMPRSRSFDRMLGEAMGRSEQVSRSSFRTRGMGVGMDDSFCGWTSASTIHYNRPQKFMTVHAWSGAKGKVTQKSGNEHTLGIGFNGGGAGWRASGTVTRSFSAEASQSGITGRKDIWNTVNYRDYKTTCEGVYRRPIGFHTLISDVTTAGTSSVHLYCMYRYAGYSFTTTDATNVTFAAGVDIGEISVSSNAGYDNGVNLNYTVTSKSKMCWDNERGSVESKRVWFYAP